MERKIQQTAQYNSISKIGLLFSVYRATKRFSRYVGMRADLLIPHILGRPNLMSACRNIKRGYYWELGWFRNSDILWNILCRESVKEFTDYSQKTSSHLVCVDEGLICLTVPARWSICTKNCFHTVLLRHDW